MEHLKKAFWTKKTQIPVTLKENNLFFWPMVSHYNKDQKTKRQRQQALEPQFWTKKMSTCFWENVTYFLNLFLSVRNLVL